MRYSDIIETSNWERIYTYEDFSEQDPDIVVWEVVERGIDKLKYYTMLTDRN